MDATLRACAQCGAAFTPSKFRPNHRWCSKPCYEQGRKGRVIAPRRARYADCPMCGSRFECTYLGRSQWSQHCSRTCAQQVRSIGKATILRRCSECSRVLRPGFGTVVCGRQCSLARGRRLWTEDAERKDKHPKVTVACKQCAQPFVYERFNGERELCGKRCADDFYRAHNPEAFRRQRRGQAQRRRAAKRSVEVERFKDVEIYERDRWICQLCGKPTHRKYSRSDILSPTLDHIVPLTQGGAHLRVNVQLAHMICNSLKGDRGSSQMRLFD